MLIQVQFIKRELLIATTAIGQLGRENELNLRIMATVPAFLLAWGAYRAGRDMLCAKAVRSSPENFSLNCAEYRALQTSYADVTFLLSKVHQSSILYYVVTSHESHGSHE